MGTGKNEKKSDLLMAILINAAILLIYLVLFSPAYEVNDDSALANLVNGSMGVYDPHVIFQNYILGFIYVHLYQITASIPWYALMQYFFILISLIVLTLCLMNHLQYKGYLGLIVSILLVFGYDLYVRPQFSKTAAVLVVAGFTLLFYTFFQDKLRKRNLFLGCLLVLLGAMYRMSVFKCILIIFSAAAFYYILTLTDYDSQKPGKRLIISLLTGAFLLLAVFGVDKFDQLQYRSESWSYYRDFNSQRVKLSDYGFPQYKGHEKEYEEMGFDLSAIKLLRRWTFQDSERYTAQSLHKIVELKNSLSSEKKIDKAYVLKFVHKFLKGLKKLSVFWCFAIAAVFCLIWGKASFKKWIALFYEMLVVLIIYAYTYYQGRFMKRRIDVGIWLAAVFVLLLIYSCERRRMAKTVTVLLAGVLLVLTLYQHGGQMRINGQNRAKSQEANRKIIEQIHDDQDHLYLKTIGTVSFYHAYGVFDPIPVGIANNQYSLGGWAAQTETARSVLDSYPVSNPICFRDMIDNDRVLLIDKNIDIMVEYLRNWYAKDAKAVKVDKIGKWNVYRIVTE
ncbi:MAG: hypothetical protein IJ137_01720 [Eubacterium sp.]|nr:hypothetical protein [Eubacterium sp.]